MERIFRFDGPVYQLMSRVWQLLVLNFLMLITSLPIITIGASQTAAFVVVGKIIRNEALLVWPEFWRNFRKNFQTSLLATIGMIVVGWVLWVNWQSFALLKGMSLLVIIGVLLVSLLWLNLVQLLFYYLARYEGSLVSILKTCLKIILSYPLRCLFIALVSWAPVVLMVMTTTGFVFGLYLSLFIGTAGSQLLRGYLLQRLFEKVEAAK